METDTVFTRKTLSEQVADNLKQAIEQGELSENSRLINSRELAKRYGVSHNVMLNSLKQLQQEQVIYLPSKRSGYHLRH